MVRIGWFANTKSYKDEFQIKVNKYGNFSILQLTKCNIKNHKVFGEMMLIQQSLLWKRCKKYNVVIRFHYQNLFVKIC